MCCATRSFVAPRAPLRMTSPAATSLLPEAPPRTACGEPGGRPSTGIAFTLEHADQVDGRGALLLSVHDCAFAQYVPDVRIGAGVEQRFHDVDIADARRLHEGRGPPTVGSV